MGEQKYTIGNIKAIFLVAIAVIFDAIKVLLFFLNVLPGIGTAIDFLVSPLISLLEDGIEFVILFFSGAYKQGGTASLVLMAATAVAGFVPFVEDFPLTTITVITTIWQSRKADKKRFAAEGAAQAAAMQRQQQEAQIRMQAAQAAADRADTMRSRAMQASIAATANDNQPTSELREAA